MIRVLRIINRFNLGGPTYNAVNLTAYLPKQYETLLIGGVPQKAEADSLYIAERAGVKPRIITNMSRDIGVLKEWRAYKEIKSIIKEFKPHIVHTHAAKAGFLGRLAAIKQKVPIIVHTFHGHFFHSYFNPIVTNTFKKIEIELAKRTDAIVAISNIQKNELCNIYKIAPENKVEVIPLGLDLESFSINKTEKRRIFRANHGISESTVIIGIIGRLVPIKNHKLLIDAIEQIKQQIHFDFEVLIIGDGEYKNELREYIKYKGLSFREHKESPPADFYFTSWIKEMDMVYPALDLVVLTSLNEGTPVSLIEAQAVGKYIISINVGGVKDILNLQAGKLVESKNVQQLIDALLQAMKNYQGLNYQAETYSKDIIQKYSHTALAQNMSNLYFNLLASKNITDLPL